MFSQSGFIVGEDRDTDSKSVSFFCIDTASGSIVWDGKTLEEQWWVGLEAVIGSKIFFHCFKKPDMPEHKTIICCDAQSGTEMWRNNDCAFLTSQPPFVYGYRDLFDRRVYYKLDSESGKFIEELNELPPDVDDAQPTERTDFVFPQPSSVEDAPSPIDFSPFTRSLSEDIRGIEYIATDAFVIFNVHTAGHLQSKEISENLTNTLYIVDRATGKKIFSEVLNKETPYPVPDSFFLDKSTLYYIKERQSLVALELFH